MQPKSGQFKTVSSKALTIIIRQFMVTDKLFYYSQRSLVTLFNDVMGFRAFRASSGTFTWLLIIWATAAVCFKVKSHVHKCQ